MASAEMNRRHPIRELGSCPLRSRWQMVLRKMPPSSLRDSWIEYSARSFMDPSGRSKGHTVELLAVQGSFDG